MPTQAEAEAEATEKLAQVETALENLKQAFNETNANNNRDPEIYSKKFAGGIFSAHSAYVHAANQAK